jgi:RNA polymerase sigma factor for flagellar operon FliA
MRVHNLPVCVDLEDLIQAGILGLIDAVSKYDAGKGVVFSTYAKHRIKGAILDSLRQLDWASRHLRLRRKQVESVTRDLSAKLDRVPTESEIAEKMGVGLDRWRQMSVDLRMIGLVSASTASNDPDGFESSTKAESQPDSICAKEELRELLTNAMKTLPERHHKVVLLYYAKDKTMKEIGGMLGVNESRVSQIHKLALEKMATTLRAAGIHFHHAF